MGRPKKSVPAPVEPEDESQETPDEEPARTIEPGPIPQGAVSQTDAARAALDAGYEKPAEAVKYIMDTFGIEMNPQYFSAIKTRTRGSAGEAKKAEPAKRGRKPKAAAPVAVKAPAPAKATPAANGESDLLESLETLKPLIASMGAEKVKRLVDLLG